MLRARKVLERDTPPGHPRPLMDFHAGNDDNLPGRTTVDAVAYANNWAFVDSLWIGEGFSYDSNPVFWLFEISGAPFGLFSDMLGAPNNYRGMLFGSTGRPGTAFPGAMWAFWDAFGMDGTDMVGWWQEDAPVTVAGQQDVWVSDAGAVLATAYINKAAKKTLVAVASWNATNTTAVLEVDWAAIGIDPAAAGGANVTVTAPAIQGFQPATEFGTVGPDGVVPPVAVAPAKGWLLVLQQH